MRFVPLACFVSAALASPSLARAECDRLTRPIANRISAALRPVAPEWARSMVAAPQLIRFDAPAFHPMGFFLGYSVLTVERLGTRGTPPFRATVALQCRGLRAEVIAEPLVWANARARELHMEVTSADMAAGYVAEVIAMSTGHRPDGASASRRAGLYRVEVTLAPRTGDAPGPARTVVYTVDRDGAITMSSAAP